MEGARSISAILGAISLNLFDVEERGGELSFRLAFGQ